MFDRRMLANFDWALLGIALAVPVLGLIVLYSAGFDPDSRGISLAWLSSPIQSIAFVRQLLFLTIGLLILAVTVALPPSFLQKIAYPAYVFGVVLLIGVLATGTVSNGARRWLDLSFFRLQPAEFMKLALILALSRYISRHPPPNGGYKFLQCIGPAILIGIPMALIMKQPDLGSALALGMIGFSILLFAGIRLRTVLTSIVVVALAIPVAWQFLHDYQKRRVLVLVDPEADPLGSGYHILQSKIAVGSGALFGRGFLNGTQSQLEFLPEHTTDFIFSVLAEEWGFVGALVVITFYGLLVYRILRTSQKSRDLSASLLVFGVGAMVFFHVVINMGMVIGLFPVVGIPLPLFSYGGSSVLCTMAALGIVLGISMRRFLFLSRA